MPYLYANMILFKIILKREREIVTEKKEIEREKKRERGFLNKYPTISNFI